MDIFSVKTRERETYEVEFKYSPLWEAALGIAAITNESLIETLELSKDKREGIRDALSQKMIHHLEYVKSHNTWKMILQVLHQQDFSDIESYSEYIKSLSPEELKYVAIPYLGRDCETKIEELVQGSEYALEFLQEKTKGNAFLPSYLKFISESESVKLKKHLIEVMEGWYKIVIEPEKNKLETILKRDIDSKEKMMNKLKPEQLVEWATDGINYLPEPSIFKVILIPHLVYRPWNVEADLRGKKVFYYPIANESLSEENKYTPNKMLVQRYKALGDENRLKILKMLRERARSLKEITDDLGMGKTTVHHHLKLLKSARLISDGDAKYFINEQTLSLLSKELQLFLEDN